MKAHALHRLLGSLYNSPHLISESGFKTVTTYLQARNAGLLSFDYMTDDSEPDEPDEGTFDPELGIGFIDITGPLMYRASTMESMCGGCSYEGILDQASDMIEAKIKTIILNCDSGGGEAYGCFEAADELRTMCDENDVQLLAYIDGDSCSAAYALACVADEVISNPFAEVGSIGVLITLMNDSEQLKQEGIERTFVTDGTDKVPFAADGSFREGFIEDLQKRVSELGDAFREHVSTYTGVSVDDLKATNAKTYSAKDAMALGLINKIQTRSEFVSYAISKHKEITDVGQI